MDTFDPILTESEWMDKSEYDQHKRVMMDLYHCVLPSFPRHADDLEWGDLKGGEPCEQLLASIGASSNNAVSFSTPGGGCGGAFDYTYHVYVRNFNSVDRYKENDCSCFNLDPDTFLESKHTLSIDMYEKEKTFVWHYYHLHLPRL